MSLNDAGLSWGVWGGVGRDDELALMVLNLRSPWVFWVEVAAGNGGQSCGGWMWDFRDVGGGGAAKTAASGSTLFWGPEENPVGAWLTGAPEGLVEVTNANNGLEH